MKLNRKIVLSLALLLSFCLATGGTIAYLTDSASALNVMTLGSVDIELIEQQRIDPANPESALEPFEQNKPMVPAVYDNLDNFDGTVIIDEKAYPIYSDEKVKNAIDKIVTTKNTGNTDAWVRTIFAFEHNDPNGDGIYTDGIAQKLHATYNNLDGSWEIYDNVLDNININGVIYSLATYTYNEKLPAGATSSPSLLQLFFDKTTTLEDMKDLGSSYDVLVLSQAVQADGFASAAEALDDAFGAMIPENEKLIASWFGDIVAGNNSAQ